MTMTINRRPLSVNVPKRKNVAAKYFNTYEWKGIVDDLNYLAVDQNSFSDCNNVYVDEEGVLRSRPALQAEDIVVKINNNETTLAHITNVTVFNDVTVYQSHNGGGLINYLTFVQKDVENSVQYEMSYTTSGPVSTTTYFDKVKLVLADQKIFIFSEYRFDYYDLEDHSIYSANNKIYVPITSIIVNGVETKGLSPNHLTSAYMTHYIYENLDSVNFGTFIGKHVIVTVNGIKYPITFQKNKQYVLVNSYTAITSQNFVNDNNYKIFGYKSKGLPLIDVSERNNMIMSVCTVTSIDNTTKVPTINWDIYYSSNGKTFSLLPATDNIVGKPVISQNGRYVIIFKKDGPYIISVLAEESDTVKYGTWTNLLQTLDNTFYSSWLNENSNNLNLINASGTAFNMTNQTNGYFVDDTKFVIAYGKTLSSATGDPNYNEVEVLTCQPNSSSVLLRTYTYQPQDSYTTDVIDAYYDHLGAMPNLFCRYEDDVLYYCVLWQLFFYSSDTYLFYLKGVSDSSEQDATNKVVNVDSLGLNNTYLVPLRNSCCFREISSDQKIMTDVLLGYETIIGQYGNSLHVRYLTPLDTGYTNNVSEITIIDLQSRDKITELFENFRIVSSPTDKNFLTNLCLCTTSDYNETIDTSSGVSPFYIPVTNWLKTDLLFNAMPISLHSNCKLMLCDDEYIYSNTSSRIEFDVRTEGEINYFIFDHEAELAEYYFSVDKDLYISNSVFELQAESLDFSESEFKWYLPEQRKQSFDYNITNLHPISANEVAIFFPNEVRYSRWDSDNRMFYYYKSKLQVGCKEGSDVITTFDGKYVIFPSERGLVAMSYQQFIATDEQTLTYLSDNIYNLFKDYLNDPNSTNEIKLEKFSFYIFVYKQDTINGFIFDLRNNSWWKISNFVLNSKIFVQNNHIKLLCNNKNLVSFGYTTQIYTLNKGESNYVDFDGITKRRINWFLISQKLYLSAINYYKTVWGLVLDSTHNEKDLNNSIYNLDTSYYDLRVTNYRKRIDNNIDAGLDGYKQSFSYKVTPAKSFVQRCNYPLVNLFQYKLNNHFENDNVKLSIPLSLSGLTIKYRIGGEIR